MGNKKFNYTMDVKGGGLTHYEKGNTGYMRLAFGEGLRVPKTQWRAWDREKYYYQKSSFARGYIFHHRSNATQQWLFHWLYGGFRGFFVQRWMVDFGLRVWFRIAWFPASSTSSVLALASVNMTATLMITSTSAIECK